jgi:AcrR family transcriptional regulator
MSEHASAAAAASVDGRVLRGERNRQAVVAAFLALLQEGDVAPTAQAVAARAGLSARSVFHHFQDMESLLASAAEAHVRQYLPLVERLPRTGPFTERLDAFVAQRSRLAEKVLPVYRAASRAEPVSDLVTARMTWATERLRKEIAEVFALELAGADSEVIEAVDALCSIETWIRWRIRQQLSVARAKRVRASGLTKLLT